MANTEDKTISLIKAGLDVYAKIMLRQTGMFLEDTEELAKEVKEYGRKNIRSDRELTLAVMAIRCLLENAYVVEFRVKKTEEEK